MAVSKPGCDIKVTTVEDDEPFREHLTALIGGAQLLPTLELARNSIRSAGLDFADAAAGSLPPPYLVASLLPTINQAPSSTEWSW